MPGKLIHTRAAMAEYDAGAAQRDRLFDAAENETQVKEWVSAVADASRKVREAFFEDTKTHNSYSACMAVGFGHLREWLKQEENEPG